MFLSKIFSIFKRKKDDNKGNSPESSPSGATVPPSGAVGAAVGLSQPDQSSSADSGQIAQAPPEPTFDSVPPSVNGQDLSSQSNDSEPSSSGQDTGTTSGIADDKPDSAPEVQPDTENQPGGNEPQQDVPSDAPPAPSPAEEGAVTPPADSGDDNQNIAV